MQKQGFHSFVTERVSGNKCTKNDFPEDVKNLIKTKKNKKNRRGILVFRLRKKSHQKGLFTFVDSFLDEFLRVSFVTLLDFSMPFYLFFFFGGGQAHRHPFVPFWNHFSIMFMKDGSFTCTGAHVPARIELPCK